MGITVALLVEKFGCGNPVDQPQLLSARLLADPRSTDGRPAPDGHPQPGESIELNFSGPVTLLEEEVVRGVTVHPPAHSLGRYRLRRGPEEHQLRLVLGEFDVKLRTSGIHGDDSAPDASGIALDYDRIGVLRGPGGRLLTGQSAVIDLSPTRPVPARLIRAEWVDENRDYLLMQGDQLRLEFDRDVRLADSIKSRNGAIPPGMFILPVEGDSFDDGSNTAYLREDRNDSRVMVLVFGHDPRVQPGGEFDPASTTVAGAPSGIALNGTTIRPQMGILDHLGHGVVSDGAVDITGQSEPFREIAGFLPGNLTLVHHAVTPFPDGRILVSGGIVASEGSEGRPRADLWLFDPTVPPRGTWERIPSPMKFPRFGHTATFMPGEDKTPGTQDDFVLIVGGYDGNKSIHGLEYFRVHDRQVLPLFATQTLVDPQLFRRFFHTAHPVLDSDTSRVVLIGGQQDKVYLSEDIDVIDIHGLGTESESVTFRHAGKLRSPRMLHQSVLYERGGPPVILLFGGIGRPWDTNSRIRPAADVVNSQVLGAPELVTGLGADRLESTLLARDPDSPSDPPGRWGHALVVLEEERWDILLLAGTTHQPYVASGMRPTPDACSRGYRIEIDTDADTPMIRYQPTGALETPRFNAAVATLPSGKALIVGGNDGHGPIASAEIYDPDSGLFRGFSEGLIAPRENPAVARMRGYRRWLVIGGTSAVVPKDDGRGLRGVLVEEYQSLE